MRPASTVATSAASAADLFSLKPIDYIVFGGFLSLSVVVGVHYACQSWRRNRRGVKTVGNPEQHEGLHDEKPAGTATDEYLMGGRKMPVLPIAFSLLTSFLSGIVMLGTPAEIFQRGVLWWVYYLSGGLAFVVPGVFFLPVFHRLGATSIYEYFERRFHSVLLRRCCAGIFLLNTIVYMSVVIYAPAVALSGVTNVGTWTIILLVGLTGTLYTTLGGLKAVVWTDTLQAMFMYAGIGIVIVKGVVDVGGFGRIWDVAVDSGRIASLNRFNPDFAQYNSVFISLLGGMSLCCGCLCMGRVKFPCNATARCQRWPTPVWLSSSRCRPSWCSAPCAASSVCCCWPPSTTAIRWRRAKSSRKISW